MSIKTQIKKELRAIERYELQHRSGIERASSLFLTAATLFSIVGLSHDTQKRIYLQGREIIVQATMQLSSGEKNETVRMPIKFDDGLRSVATTGQ